MPSAEASITSPGAAAIAAAATAPGTAVTGASWVAVPPTSADIPPANGISDAPLGDFPTEGSTFAILTTGDVNSVDNAPPSTHPGTTTELNGGNVRGNTDFDVSILKVDFTVAERMNCLRFDFRFFSDEYDEYLNFDYNDAFIAELDTSNWTTADSAISAPNNFAFDPAHEPISINAAGNTSMTAGPSDTTYDGATPVLSAAHVVTPGTHSLYLSIFDQGDHRVDSAVFVDNFVVGHAPNPDVQCAPGAAPKTFELSLAPATASNPVGGSHTVTATLKDLDPEGPVSNGKILFEASGANTATGTGTTDAGGLATFSYSGTNTGDDTITACYDLNTNDTCGAGEPLATVAATWTTAAEASATPTATPAAPANPPAGFAGLAVTGAATGLIAGAGTLLLILGVVGYLVIRRRRVRFIAE